MNDFRRASALFALPLLLSCTTPEAKPPPASSEKIAETAAPSATSAAAASPSKITMIEDDLAGAIKKAKAENKPLFVDVWAPWCHTCLSMKNFVLTDPALAPLASRVVFAAIDFDKPENAAFLEKHGIRNLPTYVVVDPSKDETIGLWIGSGSAREIRAMIEGASAEMTGERGAGGLAGDAAKAFAEARVAMTDQKPDKAAAAYERALTAAPKDWPLRSEAALGWIMSLADAKDYAGCARVAMKLMPEITGSSIPSDFSVQLLSCADELKGDDKTKARDAAIARLRAFLASPPEGATVDDRADACASLADALEGAGDKEGAKAVREQWLAMLEDAAKKAESPEIARTFDYERTNAYVALGRAEEARTMLEERQKQFPDSYEPPARLTRVYIKLGRLADAEKSVNRAIELSYGPRRLGYLKVKADVEDKLGNREEMLKTLRDVVKGYESLPQGQRAPKQLADAKKRLDEAEAKTRK